MKNIFLIGMPSSGKSTLGRKLARALNYRFVDLDLLIVKDQKKSIFELFREKGEPYFREVESRILQQTIPNHWLVVATGGGAPCFFNNMDFIKDNGISLYLDVPSADLAKRIQNHNQDDRPLLSGITKLEEELSNRLTVRLPYYSRADFILKNNSLNIRQLAEMLLPYL